MIKKRKLTPKTVRRHDPILAYEVKEIREAFVAMEPIRQIAHRFAIDPGSVRYHCRDLIDQVEPRKKGPPFQRAPSPAVSGASY